MKSSSVEDENILGEIEGILANDKDCADSIRQYKDEGIKFISLLSPEQKRAYCKYESTFQLTITRLFMAIYKSKNMLF
jgi:hypothetical protein